MPEPIWEMQHLLCRLQPDLQFSPRLTIPPSAAEKIDVLLRDNARPVALLFPAAVNAQVGRWAEAFWSRLAEELVSLGYRVFDNSSVARIASPHYSLTQSLSITEAVALSARCTVVFGLRSGMLDAVAFASRTPLYTIYPTSVYATARQTLLAWAGFTRMGITHVKETLNDFRERHEVTSELLQARDFAKTCLLPPPPRPPRPLPHRTVWPRLLLVMDSCTSTAHGTGTSNIRNLAGYPEDRLLEFYWHRKGTPHFPQSYQAGPDCTVSSAPPTATGGLALRLNHNRLKPADGLAKAEVARLIQAFNPEIVLSYVCVPPGLALLQTIADCLPSHVPIVQHFVDFLPQLRTAQLAAQLKQLAPRLTEVWSLTDSIAHTIGPMIGRPCQRIGLFSCALPTVTPHQVRPAGPGFKAVMIGNVWLSFMLGETALLWRKAMDAVPGLPTIDWFASRETIRQFRDSGIPMDQSIRDAGFFSGTRLSAELAHSDLAILPFNHAPLHKLLRGTYEHDYSRYSLPSKITEFAAHGIPIFLLAGEDTETAELVRRYDIGRVASLDDPKAALATLLAFLADPVARERCARNGRRLAEADFDQTKYQEMLLGRLSTLCRPSATIPPASTPATRN